VLAPTTINTLVTNSRAFHPKAGLHTNKPNSRHTPNVFCRNKALHPSLHINTAGMVFLVHNLLSSRARYILVAQLFCSLRITDPQPTARSSFPPSPKQWQPPSGYERVIHRPPSNTLIPVIDPRTCWEIDSVRPSAWNIRQPENRPQETGTCNSAHD